MYYKLTCLSGIYIYNVCIVLALICAILSPCKAGPKNIKPVSSTLKLNSDNLRYFTDDSGRAIYLTGSHTWANLKDKGTTDPPAEFDYINYLKFLNHYNHNFIRLWTWELTKYISRDEDEFRYVTPFPWQRTGPGNALDGKPKFDLCNFLYSPFIRH